MNSLDRQFHIQQRRAASQPHLRGSFLARLFIRKRGATAVKAAPHQVITTEPTNADRASQYKAKRYGVVA